MIQMQIILVYKLFDYPILWVRAMLLFLTVRSRALRGHYATLESHLPNHTLGKRRLDSFYSYTYYSG